MYQTNAATLCESAYRNYSLRSVARSAQKNRLYKLYRNGSFSSLRYRFQILLTASTLLEDKDLGGLR